jgi:hypothetical protein
MLFTAVRQMNAARIGNEKCLAGTIAGEAFFYCCKTATVNGQQLPVPSIAFSVQLATEFTSAAAPRTVLQAAVASTIVNRAAVIIF